MAMKSLGVSHKHSMAQPIKESDHKSYPNMTIEHGAGHSLKNKKVGHKGHMKVKYCVTGQQSYRDGTGHTNIDVTHAEDPNEEAGESAGQEQAEGANE